MSDQRQAGSAADDNGIQEALDAIASSSNGHMLAIESHNADYIREQVRHINLSLKTGPGVWGNAAEEEYGKKYDAERHARAERLQLRLEEQDAEAAEGESHARQDQSDDSDEEMIIDGVDPGLKQEADEMSIDGDNPTVKEEADEMTTHAPTPGAEDNADEPAPRPSRGRQRFLTAQLGFGEEERTVLEGEEELPIRADVIDVHGRQYPYWHYFGADWEKRVEDLWKVEAMPTPPHMTKQPHDYQLLGAARIHFLCESPFEGCMLGDEPGLGKTLEAILAMYLCREDMGMCLVVCPASLCQHWVDSVNRAFTTGHGMKAFHLKSSQTSAHTLLGEGHDVIVVSYEFLLKNWEKRCHFETQMTEFRKTSMPMEKAPKRPTAALFTDFWSMINRPWTRVFLDEVHKVKNHRSKQHEAVLKIPAYAKVCMSGTLAHNKWYDLGAYLRFLNGHPFYDFEVFLHVFASKRDEGSTNTPDVRNLNLLQKFLQACIIARPQQILKDSGKLEAVVARRITYELSNEEEARVRKRFTMYKEQMEAAMNEGGGENDGLVSGSSAKVKAAFLHAILAQLETTHPLLVLRATRNGLLRRMKEARRVNIPLEQQQMLEEMNQAIGEELSSKEDREEFLKVIKERDTLLAESANLRAFTTLYRYVRRLYPDEKMLVFSQSLGALDIAAEGLRRVHNETALRFDGSVPVNQRSRIQAEFEAAPPRTPLFLTAGAGAEGLNLQAASIVIQMGPWWNRNQELQALSRAYRMGQKQHEVKHFQMFAKNSEHDIWVLQAQTQKTGHIADVMEPLMRKDDAGPAVIDILFHQPRPRPAFDLNLPMAQRG